ncbi:hypothetical protein F0562_017638 [Nyssa sinensis]|uniref:Retrotransposon Copia-like N-terminal domain-containing protein n=1 Tax=Nyssa sinensis TaxID=561372 RepID=A0A5J4ZI77_9ASTE|nr:hypothetical protein F0562_017638 [Nyssa sinensis]
MIVQNDSSTMPFGFKLNGSNYSIWSQMMELHVTGQGKLGYLTGKTPQVDESNSAFMKWYTEDAIVKGWLLKTMKPYLLRLFLSIPTTKDVWEGVSQMYYDRSNESQIYELHCKATHIKQGGLPIPLYFTELKSIWIFRLERSLGVVLIKKGGLYYVDDIATGWVHQALPLQVFLPLREGEGGVQNMNIEEDRPGISATPSQAEPRPSSSATPNQAEPCLACSQVEWIQPELRQVSASQSELSKENLKDLDDFDLTQEDPSTTATSFDPSSLDFMVPPHTPMDISEVSNLEINTLTNLNMVERSFQLPPRQNRGKLPNRFSPKGRTKYSIVEYVSTHRLSP